MPGTLRRSIILVPVLAAVSQAQFVSWTGPTDGAWSGGSNWSGGSSPGSSHDVLIEGTAGQNVAVTIDVSPAIRSLQIGTGDTASLTPGQTLSLSLPLALNTFGGSGTFNVGSLSAGAFVTSPSGMSFRDGLAINLFGRSRITASNAIAQDNARVVGTGSVISPNYSIGSLSLLEARPLNAGVGTLATLNVDAPYLGNSGTLSAAGGTLALRAGVLASSTFVPPGVVQVTGGGRVVFREDVHITGQRFIGDANGLIMLPETETTSPTTFDRVHSSVPWLSERLHHRIMGYLINASTMTFSRDGGMVELGQGSTTISGNGTLVFHGTSMAGPATSTLLHSGHSIVGGTGTGSISVGTLSNSGLIEANQPGSPLTLAPTSRLINPGTIRAVGGAELRLSGPSDLIDNRFGRISARDAGSKVVIDHTTTLLGGSLESDELGEIVLDAPAGTFTLDNTVNSGRLRIQSGTLTAASGQLLNSGTVTFGNVRLAGTVELLGSGRVFANGQLSGGTLINRASLISGTGTIGQMTNEAAGVVDASSGSLNVSIAHRNNGLMRASNGGTLRALVLDNTAGSIEAAGASTVILNHPVNSGTLIARTNAAMIVSTNATSPLYMMPGGVTLMGPGSFSGTGSVPQLHIALANNQQIRVGDNAVLAWPQFYLSGSSTVDLIGTPRATTLQNPVFAGVGATVNFSAGTLELQGTVQNRVTLLAQPGQPLALMPVGVATLSGAGTIVGVSGASGTGRLVNIDNTVVLSGSGFGLWQGGWENYGTLAGQSAGAQLNVVAPGNAVNRGDIISGASSSLLIVGSGGSGSVLPTLDNRGGAIRAFAGGTVLLNNVTTLGGVFESDDGTIAPATGGSFTMHNALIRGKGVGTGAGRLLVSGLTTLADGATLTIGHPDLNGGALESGEAPAGAEHVETITGSGFIRVLPRGTFGDRFYGLVDGPVIFGAGTIGGAGVGSELTIGPSSSVIARVLEGIAGAPVMRVPLRGDHKLFLNGMMGAEAGARLELGSAISSVRFEGPEGSFLISSGGVMDIKTYTTTRAIINHGTLIVSNFTNSTGTLEGEGTLITVGGSMSANRVALPAVRIEGTSGVRLINGTRASRIEQLSISPAARLTISNSAAVIDYAAASPAGEIRAWLISGYNGGSWNGSGISITPNTAPVPRGRAIGYAEATDVGLSNATFVNEPVDGTAVLLRYTYYGDADLSGTVNLADFTRLAGAFGTSSTWSSGDFNYDGVTNLDDFTALAANFGLSLADAPAPHRSAVPEPTALSALAVSAAMFLRRRPD